MTVTKIPHRVRRCPQVDLVEGRALLSAEALDTAFPSNGVVHDVRPFHLECGCRSVRQQGRRRGLELG